MIRVEMLIHLLNASLEERDAERMADEKVFRQQVRELVKAGKLTLAPKE